MLHLWLVYRFITSGRRLLNLPSMMSLIGMALGVASLMASMAVVNGFESTLKEAITDVYGHVLVVRRGQRPQNVESILSAIKEVAPEAQTFTPFLDLEAVMVGQGILAGALVQGVDPDSVESVLNVRKRVIEGEFSLQRKPGEAPVAMVGKALAKKFSLKIGEEFKVVLPSPSRLDSTEFAPKVQAFRLGAILDLGKAEYDERYIMTDIRSAQDFGGVGDNFSGIRLRVSDRDQASAVASRLSSSLGMQYWVNDWTEVNRNLLEAIEIEKPVIFLVIMMMVVAASFNISSNLFVSVLQKYSDVSVLRALGFSQKDVARVFMYQGLFFGLLGTVAGLLLGLLLCLIFVVAQRYVVLLPAETYRIDHVGVDLRLTDTLAIIAAAFVICLISTLIPARRGAKLDPVEGLRYE